MIIIATKLILLITGKQWYYNNAYQEVVTSIYFMKIKTKVLQNHWDSNLGQEALHRSTVLCQLGHQQHTSVRDSLIIQDMTVTNVLG